MRKVGGLCSVEDCGRDFYAHTFCTLHYRRVRVHGSPDLPVKPTFLERFWSHVDRRGPDECWVWTGGNNGRGYGKFDGQYAHRIAYEDLADLIPDGTELDHLCRVHACVNPAHLEPVSHRTNTLRGDTIPARRVAQTHCVNGHEFTAATTYIVRDGTRQCRPCCAERTARYRKEARSVAAA